MDRRSFLGGILAFAAAPAIVRAQSLMPVRALQLVEPDDTELIQRLFNQGGVVRIPRGTYHIRSPIILPPDLIVYGDGANFVGGRGLGTMFKFVSPRSNFSWRKP